MGVCCVVSIFHSARWVSELLDFTIQISGFRLVGASRVPHLRDLEILGRRVEFLGMLGEAFTSNTSEVCVV